MIPKNGNATMYTSGWPKNQNKCWYKMAPPLAASNTCAPKCRSASSPNSAAVSTGNTINTNSAVTKIPQVKIGIRHIVIPGARMHTTVVIMLTPPRMVPRPDSAKPMIHRSPPAPGEFTESDNGGYAVQPNAAAPSGVMNPNIAVMVPNKYSQ